MQISFRSKVVVAIHISSIFNQGGGATGGAYPYLFNGGGGHSDFFKGGGGNPTLLL